MYKTFPQENLTGTDLIWAVTNGGTSLGEENNFGIFTVKQNLKIRLEEWS